MAAAKFNLQPGALLGEADSYAAKLDAEGMSVTEEKSICARLAA